MKELNGRKVEQARLHSTIHLGVDIGQVGPDISTDTIKAKRLTLTKVSDGLLVESDLKNKQVSAFVPNGNIACLRFAPEVVTIVPPTKPK